MDMLKFTESHTEIQKKPFIFLFCLKLVIYFVKLLKNF